MKRDYYEVLGVERDVDAGELKKAYRKLAAKFHPDRNQNDPTAEASFKEVSEAYQVLSDGQKRQAYDRFGHEGLRGDVGFGDVGDIFSSFHDILGDFFGGMGGGRRANPNAPAAGADLRTRMIVTLEEAVFGVERELQLKHPTPCEPCRGTGAEGGKLKPCATCGGAGQVGSRRGAFIFQTACPACRGRGAIAEKACSACKGQGEVDTERTLKVSIPAGIDDGQTLRLHGQGQNGRNGGPTGHLLVEVAVRPDPRFAREGLDLLFPLHVSFPQAALGAVVEVPSLKTGDAPTSVRVTAGIQPGETIEVKNAGVPRLDGRGRGSLICVVHVDVPKDLSPKASELIEELGRIL